MAEYTYDQIKQIVANNGGLPPAIASTINAQQAGATGPQTFTGTTTIDIGKYQFLIMIITL